MRIPLRSAAAAGVLALALAACGASSTLEPRFPAPTPSPIKIAACDTTPAPGSLPQADGSIQPIVHPPVDCGGLFFAYVDFTLLGDKPGCRNVAAAIDPDHGRPCSLPTRNYPDFQVTETGSKELWPVEGERISVFCQITGDHTLSRGTLQNVKGEQSNVWDFVYDDRYPQDEQLVKLAGYSRGYLVNDLWLGNAGWRDNPCFGLRT